MPEVCRLNNQSILAWLIFFSLASIGLVLTACERQSEPIKIGFIASLTGRAGDVGIAARDGAQLAIDQTNLSGGILGRPVELVVHDIGNDPDKASGIVRELTRQSVFVSVGPVLSSMAVVLAPLADDVGLLLVSPTVATNTLGDKDDLFLRTYPECRETATALANHVYGEQHRRMAIILDQSNRAFTEDWRDVFTKSFESKGGEVVTVVDYHSGADQGFLELTTEALMGKPDGLLLLGSAIDAAMISQQVAKLKKDLPIFTSEWSFTRDLLTHGGRTVEGITLFHTYNEQSQTDRYLQFVAAFKQRFRSTPSFPAVHGYDAVKFVLAGLKQGARSGPELKQYLLNLGEFESLQSSFKLNEYGDVKRELYLTKIRNGSFEVVK